MPIARANIIRGPAQVQYNSVTIYSKDDIQTNIDRKTNNIETSNFGKADERDDDIIVKIPFTPVGEWESLATLFPYATMNIGDSVYGTDRPLIVWAKDTKKFTFQAAAITKMPQLILSATKTMLGALEFSCIRKDNTAWATADSLFDVTTGAYPGDAAFAVANILTQPYAAAWGLTPWDAILTQDGWTIDFELGLEPVYIDDIGTIDMTLASLAVMAKCKPLNVTEAQIDTALLLQNTGAARGRSLSAGGANLNISATGVYVRLYNAALKTGGFMFGQKPLRQGEIGFISTRTFTAGVPDPLFYVGTAAP